MDRTTIVHLLISAALIAQGLLIVPTLQLKPLRDQAQKATHLLHRQTHAEATKVPFRLTF
jgi:hypothetical protein